jgi:hypothetical protein
MVVRRALRYLCWTDLLLVLWVSFCIVVALAIGAEVRKLDRYGTTMDQSAEALRQTAEALRLIERLPLVGDSLRDVTGEILATSSRIEESATHTRESANRLSILLTVAIIVLPTAPALAIYLPQRIREFNMSRELLRSLRDSRNSEFLRNYLANRALTDLPYETLEKVGQDPWTQVRQGQVHQLVASELRRLGLDGEVSVHQVAGRETKR